MSQSLPVDPRLGSGLPDLGTLPVALDVGDDIVRVIAPNPSPMTLDGTNTYLVIDRSKGEALIVDPGPISDLHLGNVEMVLNNAGARAVGIVLTHHHIDHSETATLWSKRFSVSVNAFLESYVSNGGRLLLDGDELRIGKRRIQVISTPGHTDDHLAFRVDDGSLLTGDHILGRSTSVIVHPDGNIEKYLASLVKLRDLGHLTLLPGHGPEISKELSSGVIEYYLRHRNYRIMQIISQLEEAGALDVDSLTRQIYGPELHDTLFVPARLSTLAALSYLIDKELVGVDENSLYRLT